MRGRGRLIFRYDTVGPLVSRITGIVHGPTWPREATVNPLAVEGPTDGLSTAKASPGASRWNSSAERAARKVRCRVISVGLRVDRASAPTRG